MPVDYNRQLKCMPWPRASNAEPAAPNQEKIPTTNTCFLFYFFINESLMGKPMGG